MDIDKLRPGLRGCVATSHEHLVTEIMDSNIPKNEHGWAARREIESLRERAEKAEAELAALKAKIAEAPWTIAQDTYIGHRYALVHYAMDERHCGKRVRLVVED